MKEYPNVMSEHDTIEAALAGRSLARFGDGELRLALGGSAISQVTDLDLQQEFKRILRGPSKALVCIPRQGSGPKAENWRKYAVDKFVRLYGDDQEYGSSFVTRPDNAPVIANPEYMATIRKLWSQKDIVLVVGTDYGSLREKDMAEARSLRVVYGPRRDAYSSINEIEEKIGKPSGAVILCLGATATCLAERLARKGVHALDLGHIGRFMHRYEHPTKNVPASSDIPAVV